MIETTRPPSQRQTVRPLAEEPFPEHFAEFSEIEKLGLDKNRFPIIMRGQAEAVPKAVAWLQGFGYVGDKELADVINERFDEAFQYFKLNIDKYDEVANPSGMLNVEPYTPENTKQLLVLRMLGVNEQHILSDFFGLSQGTRKAPNRLNTESPAFGTVHDAQETKRDRFLIDHRAEYRAIDNLFNELETAYGLKASEIFKPGSTPRLKPKGNDVYTMEQHLIYVLAMLSGTVTAAQLERSRQTRGMQWPNVRSRLTPSLGTLIEEKRKKGR